jgi:hypothetical protein
MKSRYIALLTFFFLSFFLGAQVTKHSFEVEFKGKKIGHIYALHKVEGEKDLKDLRTNTDVSLFAFSVHVESEVELMKSGGHLIASKCYRHANRGSNDILAHIEKINSDPSYKVHKNDEVFEIGKSIQFCVIDLYFEEPVDQTVVFSNMHASFLDIQKKEADRYEVITPDGNSTIYSYRNGELVQIEMKTTIGTVLCKKNS